MTVRCQTKHALLSRVYGEQKSFTVKVVNDSNFFVTFKKGKKIGHAEAATQISPEQAQVLQSSNLGPTERPQSQEAQVQTDKEDTDMPAHLKQMFLDNNSELSDEQKLKFKNLISEFADIFSQDDFDLGCLKSGVEHKIQTLNEIPVNEKFRRTPLQFQN